MEITIPEAAAVIIQTLNDAGYEAYVVGGCVRDSLMGRQPDDWDITTSAKPEQVKALFCRTVDTGIQHGTVTVMIQKEGYEVTTYRIDGEYEDCRHPKAVSFTSNLKEDLKRRDFTMNAMAYHPTLGLVDEFEGVADMKAKVIRCVGEPRERFEEDALRMLRAIRFAGQLDFAIDNATLQAIHVQAERIQMVSAERVRVELDKLLRSPAPDKLLLASKEGLLAYILPEYDRMLATPQNNPHHQYNVGMHVMKALEHGNILYQSYCNEHPEYQDEKVERVFVWSTLLHDVAKPVCLTTDETGKDHFYGHDVKGAEMAKTILRRLKFDNYTIDMVTRLVRWHDYRYEPSKKALRRAMNKIGVDILTLLFLLQEADILAQSEYKRDEKYARLREGRSLINQIQEAEEAVTLSQLAVTGKDLINKGVKPGKEIGVILSALLEHVWEVPEDNKKEILMDLADGIAKKG